MKEKRYFCDYCDNFFNKLRLRTLDISLAVSILLGFTISYIVILNTKWYKFAEYSAETYEYLDEIADTVIQPGIGINLAKLPDDVKYEIKSEDDEIVFYYHLDANSVLAPSASMTVKLSNNCNIISKKPNIESEKEYIAVLNLSVFLLSLCGAMIWETFMFS